MLMTFELSSVNICFVFSSQLYSEGVGGPKKSIKIKIKPNKKTLHSHEMKEDPTIVKLKFSSLGHEQTVKILFILYFRMVDGYGP